MTPPEPRLPFKAAAMNRLIIEAEERRLASAVDQTSPDRSHLELTVPEPEPLPKPRGDWGCGVLPFVLAVLGAVFVWWRT